LPTAPPRTTTTVPDTSPDGTTQVAPSGDWRPDLNGCDNPERPNETIADTIRIGVIGPTGRGLEAAAAAGIVDGMKAYYDAVNEAGGIDGIGVEVVVADDSGDPTLTPGVLASMLDDGIDIVAGTIGTASSLAVLDELNAQCVPNLFSISAAAALSDVADSPWTTSLLPSPSVEVAASIDSARTALGGEPTIGVLFSDNDFGRSYRDAAISVAGAPAVLAEVPIDPTTPVVEAVSFTDIANAEPSVLFLAADSVGCATSLTALTTWLTPDWQPLVYLAGPCMTRFTASLAGPAITGVRSAAVLRDIDDPDVQAVAGVADLVGRLPSDNRPLFTSNAALGWQAAELTVGVLRAAASSAEGLTQASIISAARGTSAEMTLGYPGIVYQLDGTDDAVGVQQVQLVEWDTSTESFTTVGDVYSG
jgi:branched-chain amino acid transport system substrate-binding protein